MAEAATAAITAEIEGEMSGRSMEMVDSEGTKILVQRKFDPIVPIPKDSRMRSDYGGITVHKVAGRLIVSLDRATLTLADMMFAIEILRRHDNTDRNLTVTSEQIKAYVNKGYYARNY